MKFEKEYFQKFNFTQEQIERFLANAQRDIKIAQNDRYPEVRFTYSYQALIKLGIAILAQVGGVKVRSIPGYHLKILDKLSHLLNDKDIFSIANAMRMKRNFDLYGGGESISEKEASEYLEFVENVFKKAKNIFGREPESAG